MLSVRPIFLPLVFMSVLGIWAATGAGFPGRIIYVSDAGNNAWAGTKFAPVRTIQHAYDIARPGDSIRAYPGVYRETVTLTPKADARTPISILGMTINGNRAVLSGSEPASSFTWRTCQENDCPHMPDSVKSHVYVTELPDTMQPSTVAFLAGTSYHPLPIAREPDYRVTDASKYHQYWWIADEGVGAPTRLTDTANDGGRETGSLSTLPNIAGGRLFIIDGQEYCGSFQYVRTIKSHNISRGFIDTDEKLGAVMFGYQHPGIGKYATYFVENSPGLLDTPGEWYFDHKTQTLFLYPPVEKNPKELPIEIGARENGLLIQTSGVRVRGLSIRNTNDHIYNDAPTAAVSLLPRSSDISDVRIADVVIENAGNGLRATAAGGHRISDIVASRLRISDTSKSAITFIGDEDSDDSVSQVTVTRSTLSHTGYPYNESAISVYRARGITLSGNGILDTASNGIHVTGFEKQSRTSRDIRITGNVVEHACQNSSGCAAIKLFGGAFSNTEVSRNTMRDTIGWSYCNEQTIGGRGYGIGVFISNAEGIRVSGNIVVNSSAHAYLAYTRQLPARDNIFSHNTASYSDIGISLQSGEGAADINPDADRLRHERTEIVGNTLVHNRIALSLDPGKPDFVTISGNMLRDNAYALEYGGTLIATPSAIGRLSPFVIR